MQPRLGEADVAGARLHINLGVIGNKNIAPWELFPDRKDGCNFPSAYSGGDVGGAKKSQASLSLFVQPEHKAGLRTQGRGGGHSWEAV